MAATKKSIWYAARGVTAREARQLERALGALADNDNAVRAALTAKGIPQNACEDVCAAIRHIIDGWERI